MSKNQSGDDLNFKEDSDGEEKPKVEDKDKNKKGGTDLLMENLILLFMLMDIQILKICLKICLIIMEKYVVLI